MLNINKIVAVRNPEGNIVFADGKEVQYFPSIASFEGWKVLKADLSMLDEKDLARTLSSLQTTGARAKFLFAHTYSGTKSGMFQLVEKQIKNLFDRSFPNLKDISRPGAFFTPCINGVYRIKALRILIVSDKASRRYQIGDGQGVMTTAGFEFIGDQMLEQSNNVLRWHPFQFRMMINAKNAKKNKKTVILAKGMINPSNKGISHPELSRFGEVHIVLPLSCVKGRWKEGMHIVDEYDVTFGVMAYAKKGKMALGYMVGNMLTEPVHAKMREDWSRIAKLAHEMAKDAKTFIKSLPPQPLRNEDGSVDIMGFIRGAAMTAEDIDNFALLEHTAFARKLGEIFAAKNIRFCLSNGVEATRLTLLCDDTIEDGVVYGNREDIIPGRNCVIRYPITLYSGVAVNAFVRDFVFAGTLLANRRTLAILAADQDGDAIGIVSVHEAEWIATWWDTIKDRKIKTDKFRSKAKMTATNAVEMGVATRLCDTGRCANVLTQMRAACHKNPSFFEALKLWVAVNGVIPAGMGPFEFMELQVQAAVDSTKTGSMPDSAAIEKIAKYMKENWIGKEDWAFAQIGNGSAKVWRLNDENKYLIPSSLSTSATPVGRALVELGDKLPQLQFTQLNNEYFMDWLPYCTNDEARIFVDQQWGMLQDTLKRIHNEDGDMGDVFGSWEIYWNSIRTSQTPEIVEQMALRFWEIISTGGNDVKASRWCAWTALPEVIFDLLRRNKNRLVPTKAQIEGTIAFSGLGDIMGEKESITMECNIVRNRTKGPMTRECFQPVNDKKMYFMVNQETPMIRRKGKVTVTFFKTAKKSTYNFVIHGEIKATTNARARLERALA